MNKTLSLAILLVLILSGYFLAPYFIGKAPKKKFVKPEASIPQDNPHQASSKEEFPELNRLRTVIEGDPSNLQVLQELAENLKGKVIATRDKNLIFELIDVLNKILAVDSQNTFALLELANITFESKVFSKAKNYYQRYLEVKPEDNLVRTRYASSLIFLKEIDAAIQELDKVLDSQANDFSALSYKAIAYAELGDLEQAIKVGDQALEVAPAPDVKARFSSYLETLKNPKSTNPKKDIEVVNNLENYLITNQVTASKFVRLEDQGDKLLIYLKNFPMAGMPEFAKQKFFNSLKLNLKKDQAEGLYQLVEKLRFIDEASQEELDALIIN